jgi:hypothetical protein
LGARTVDDGDAECVFNKDDSECAFVGARTIDTGDVINHGKDLRQR